MTCFKDIVNLIKLDIDSDTVTIGDEQFNECSLQPASKLSQWLYCTLHTGNSSLLSSDVGEELNNKIVQSVIEKSVTINGKNQKCFGVPCINVGGVRVYSSENNKVKISKFRPNLTPGFFLYMSSVMEGELLSNTDRYYIYSNNPSKAIKLWSLLIQKLENLKIPFTIKVLSNTSSYPRTDAIVLYSTKEDSQLVKQSILEVTSLNYFESEKNNVSPLCKKLTNIVSFAEQPKFNGKHVSFGEDRCDNIAAAIKDAMLSGLDFSSLLKKRFENAGINPMKIYEGM